MASCIGKAHFRIIRDADIEEDKEYTVDFWFKPRFRFPPVHVVSDTQLNALKCTIKLFWLLIFIVAAGKQMVRRFCMERSQKTSLQVCE